MTFTTRCSTFSRALRLLLAAALWATGIHASIARDDPALPGEILVKLRTTQALAPLLSKYQLSVISQFGSRPIYRLGSMGTTAVNRVIPALLLETDVLLAEPNTVNSSPEARRNVVWAIGNASGYAVQWAPAALRLTEAHGLSTGAGVRVAVLDTGVDRTHPALAGRLLPGFDFVDYDDNPSEEGNEADVSYGHGTHVAGLVALVAPNAKIMPVRVLDPSGQSNAWVLSEALLYAVNPDGDPATADGAHVINLSLGTATRTRLFDAIAQIVTCSVDSDPVNDISDPGYDADEERCSRTGGVVIVAAAGNDGSSSIKEYPAAETGIKSLVAVGASAANSKLALFSNTGSWIRFTAPGDRVTSSVPGGGYGTWSGSSMAAPLAAGSAALLRAMNPGMKPDEVIRRLISRTSALCGASLRQIDAYAALRDVQPANTICK